MTDKQKREYAFLKAMFKYLLFMLLWVVLEYHFYGETRPSGEDSFIAFVLFYYINQCEYRKLNLV